MNASGMECVTKWWLEKKQKGHNRLSDWKSDNLTKFHCFPILTVA